MELVCLEPTATIADIEKICRKAIEEKYHCITVPPLFVKKAKELLLNETVKLSTVIGYPYGWSSIESKVAEIILAMIDGADELEIVINITALKNNDWQYLAKELNTLMTIIRKQDRSINIIIETALLNKEDIIRCCDLYGVAGVNCLSLSTGIKERSVAFDTVRLVRSHLAEQVDIKINSSNLDKDSAYLYRQAGAGRIGLLVK